ncbi:MAG: hypothetical protein JXM79_17385 [Sedimentisphaerales bacterium]|nr:hypothetical protein [Sedimentisphaerales bacterium]
MEIKEKHQKEIESIIADIDCNRDPPCYQSEFKNLRKAQDTGLENFINCSEDNPTAALCHFSLSFGERYLCKCPLRIYLAKHLDI